MDETNVAQLVFALSAARQIALREGPDFDLAVYHIRQAIQATKDEAFRQGIVVIDQKEPDHLS
ncbi:hypothetical protein [Rhizobium sp. Root1220]|uniref:hypothetical protein n=1 Tax=Rhizobium sp. Root1220 TaxID=1736432 RepID=UPI0006FCE306|nr:hypothetical protein [Rhizobium sp. Root1220]KQV84040.1 hypothetical protein ASC90_00485 [Rhizobium sp. Root1220]